MHHTISFVTIGGGGTRKSSRCAILKAADAIFESVHMFPSYPFRSMEPKLPYCPRKKKHRLIGASDIERSSTLPRTIK